ncbi:hypothetical protein D915_009911 [Fasciola hepatica]|uniref:Uncharacterized protein n=1 Tax=Fasciola hepatica TaxID=6192 RepID=A0A4E0RWB2_FASHE|nr:hypothetical protein D915_009911 [Fasciola hepatica]
MGISTPKLAVWEIPEGTLETDLLSRSIALTAAITSSSCALTTDCFWRVRTSAVRSGMDSRGVLRLQNGLRSTILLLVTVDVDHLKIVVHFGLRPWT